MRRFIPFFGRRGSAATQAKRRDMPDGLWLKCPACGEIVFKNDLEQNLGICPNCSFHFQISREERLASLIDEGTFEEWDAVLHSVDRLGFKGVDSYESKLKQNVDKTGHYDAVTSGKGRIGPHTVGIGVMDFKFLGASMGSVVGEKITRLIERSTEEKLPVVICCASGGARMYEGMLSLMQMAKTSAALARHAAAGLAYIPVLTHPTTAGVMASFATLGDVILAEPGALIGFAGPRVIKETTQSELPEGFQRSEFLLDHGLIDCVVPRDQLKEQLIHLLDFLAAPAAS